MKRATPKPEMTIESLSAQVSNLHDVCSDTHARLEHAAEAVRNEQRLENTIRELEARIANDALKAARMDGYLDRVAEEDQLRAGFIQVEQAPEVRPARQGRRHFGAGGSSVANGAQAEPGGVVASGAAPGGQRQWQEVKPMRRFRYTE